MKKTCIAFALAGCLALPAHAEGLNAQQSAVMEKLLAAYAEKAKVEAKEKKGRGRFSDKPFTAEAGREFYLVRRTWQTNDYTCSGCHTEDPKKEGKHIDTKKAIKPLAPSVNPERFTDAAKVEKNFTEHCLDLHERDCSAYEKGIFITYLKSVR